MYFDTGKQAVSFTVSWLFFSKKNTLSNLFQDTVSGIGRYFEFLLWGRKEYMYNLVFT